MVGDIGASHHAPEPSLVLLPLIFSPTQLLHTSSCHIFLSLTTFTMNTTIRLACSLVLVVLQCSWQVAANFDRFFPDSDECLQDDGTVGPCDTSRFPTCSESEMLCYNRRPRSDKFYPDRLPMYFIDYQSVLCYPDTWRGCSSCHPGRLCLSEQRCILDEQNYECETWY